MSNGCVNPHSARPPEEIDEDAIGLDKLAIENALRKTANLWGRNVRLTQYGQQDDL